MSTAEGVFEKYYNQEGKFKLSACQERSLPSCFFKLFKRKLEGAPKNGKFSLSSTPSLSPYTRTTPENLIFFSCDVSMSLDPEFFRLLNVLIIHIIIINNYKLDTVMSFAVILLR